ncbi:MAG: hypothetical protein H2069_06445 [Legionella sp.]|nr:hypothetical protein [Legionella sp.]
MLTPFNLSQKTEEELCQLLALGTDQHTRNKALALSLKKDFPMVIKQLITDKEDFAELGVREDEWVKYLLWTAAPDSVAFLFTNAQHIRRMFSKITFFTYKKLFLEDFFKMPVEKMKIFLSHSEWRGIIIDLLQTYQVNSYTYENRHTNVQISLSYEQSIALLGYSEFFPMPPKLSDLFGGSVNFFNAVLAKLKTRKEQVAPGVVFNVSINEARALLYMIHAMLDMPMSGKEDALKFLLMLPNVNSQAHLPLFQPTLDTNLLLKTACKSGETPIIEQFLGLPKVSQLAQKNNFYSNKKLAHVYSERKKRMSEMSVSYTLLPTNTSSITASFTGFFTTLSTKFSSTQKDNPPNEQYLLKY